MSEKTQELTQSSLLKEVWGNYNISTVMVLPLFWKISHDVLSKREGIRFPFLQLAFEYGLINTFLFKDGVMDGNLYLLFKKEDILKNLELTRSDHLSLFDLISSSEYYSYLENIDNFVLIGLKIPSQYLSDIDKIIAGKYSEISKEYKNEIYLKNKYTHIPITNHKVAVYMLTNDLAYAISIKALHLKRDLDEALGIDLDSNMEFFNIINLDNENFITDIIDTVGILSLDDFI